MIYSKAKRDYNAQYTKDNIRRIPLDVQKDLYEKIKTAAGVTGKSVNGYIKQAIDERIERDSSGTPPAGPQGARVVSLSPESLETAQRAAHVAQESVDEFVDRAVRWQAMRDKTGHQNMILISPGLLQDAETCGFAAGETVREFIERAVRQLVERERNDLDEMNKEA